MPPPTSRSVPSILLDGYRSGLAYSSPADCNLLCIDLTQISGCWNSRSCGRGDLYREFDEEQSNI